MPLLVVLVAAGCGVPAAPTPTRNTVASSPATTPPQRPAESAPTAATSVLSELLQRREKHRRILHDGTQRAVAACMASRGFAYTPIPYPGALGPHPDLVGLTRAEADRWTLALRGQPIPPEVIAGPDPITDPTIAIVRGPEGAIYFRRDACTAIGRTAVYGDLVEWHIVELTVDHLAGRAVAEAGGDKQRRIAIELRLAAEHRATIDRFARLQDAAIDRARRLLAKRR